MDTEYIQTPSGLIERDFGYEKPHKYGTEFASGRSTVPELDIKYVRVTNREAFLADYTLPEFDILNIIALKSDGSIKLFRPDDTFDFREQLRMPRVSTYGTSFDLNFQSFDYYYVPQNGYQYNIWEQEQGLPRLELPRGIYSFVRAVKVVDNKIVGYKHYGFDKKRKALEEIGEYLHSGEKVQAGGELYYPLDYNAVFSFI